MAVVAVGGEYGAVVFFDGADAIEGVVVVGGVVTIWPGDTGTVYVVGVLVADDAAFVVGAGEAPCCVVAVGDGVAAVGIADLGLAAGFVVDVVDGCLGALQRECFLVTRATAG